MVGLKEYFRLLAVLILPLIVVVAYALSDISIVIGDKTLKKAAIRESLYPTPQKQETRHGQKAENNAGDRQTADKETPACTKDTTAKRILLFGDSMVEGLAMRLAEYAAENGHTFHSVCWYGSTTLAWASHPDTLRSILNWSEADYILVSLGGNELRTTDLDRRRDCVHRIEEVLGQRPTVWIAPPSWVSQPTITTAIQEVVGTARYFDSTRLRFTRGTDGMHPTFGSSSRWMDSIAVWLASTETAHPIRMDCPSRKYPRRWKHKIIRQ